MPGKSRSKKAKYSAQSKKKKGGIVNPAMTAQQSAVTQTRETAPPSKAPAARASASTTAAKPISYPYIAAELRTIGILASTILVVLIVLALVLS